VSGLGRLLQWSAHLERLHVCQDVTAQSSKCHAAAVGMQDAAAGSTGLQAKVSSKKPIKNTHTHTQKKKNTDRKNTNMNHES